MMKVWILFECDDPPADIRKHGWQFNAIGGISVFDSRKSVTDYLDSNVTEPYADGTLDAGDDKKAFWSHCEWNGEDRWIIFYRIEVNATIDKIASPTGSDSQ